MNCYRSVPARFFTPYTRALTRLAVGSVLAAASAACGAATGLDFDPPSKDAPPTQSSPQPNPRPANGSPRPSGNSPGNPTSPGNGGVMPGQGGLDLPTFELGECKRGERPNRVEECPYLAEGLCYNDVQSACACICPRDTESLCLEGLFLNVWNGVDVRCSAR